MTGCARWEEWQSARAVAGALWRGWVRALRRRDGSAWVILPYLWEAWGAVLGGGWALVSGGWRGCRDA